MTLPISWPSGIWLRRSGKTGASPMWLPVISTARISKVSSSIPRWILRQTRRLGWPEVLQKVTGHDDALVLDGTETIVEPLLKPGGMARLAAYLAERPGLAPEARRKIFAVFLDKFGDPNALEDSFDLPGWTEAVVWELSRGYELDMERIAAIPDVGFLRA